MNTTLETTVRDRINHWRQEGLPGYDALAAEADALAALAKDPGTRPLWKAPPLLLTATLDDALGQGLTVIHRFADAVGLQRRHLGLTIAADAIIAACRAETPALLGMTVLQFDSEEDLARIRREIPTQVRMVCGGPLFKADPELAERCGIDFVAGSVSAFLEYLLDNREALDATL
jgi:hypothetical protein